MKGWGSLCLPLPRCLLPPGTPEAQGSGFCIAPGDKKGMGWGEMIKKKRDGGSQIHFLDDKNPTLRDSLLSAVFIEEGWRGCNRDQRGWQMAY